MRFMIIPLLLSAAVHAQVVRQMAHEGRLLRADGSPERGSVELTFRIYDAPAGGSVQWTETQSVTLSADGFYAAVLGRLSPLPALPGGNYWLGVQVTGEPEMAPRALLAAAPFALRAAAADDADRLGGDASSAVLRWNSPLDAGRLQAQSGPAPAAVMPPEVPLLSGGKLADSVLSANVPLFTQYPVLRAANPGGAAEAIVTAVRVTARANVCSGGANPRMEVYINGARVGATDVTNTSYADTVTFSVSPPRLASEVSVAYTNDAAASMGTCGAEMFVQKVTLTTVVGAVELWASDQAHAVYDKDRYFDGVDVEPASEMLHSTGALRFFLAPPAAPSCQWSHYDKAASWNNSTSSNNWTTVVSRSLTMPAPGKVWVMGYGHGFPTNSSYPLDVAVFIDNALFDPEGCCAWGMAISHNTGSWVPIVATALTSLSPGAHTLDLRFRARGGTATVHFNAPVMITQIDACP